MSALNTFNELVELIDNPKALEKRKKEIINEAIDKCPKRLHKQLRCKQWKLEQELNKYKDPVARMNKMVEIFWIGVNTFEETLRSDTTNTGDVLPFKKNNK